MVETVSIDKKLYILGIVHEETASTTRNCYQFVYGQFVVLKRPIFYLICLQVWKNLTLKTLRMRGRQGSGLSRKRRLMPQPSLGILSRKRVEKIVKLCRLHLKMSTMQKNCRQWMLSVKLLSWKSCFRQNMMIIT